MKPFEFLCFLSAISSLWESRRKLSLFTHIRLSHMRIPYLHPIFTASLLQQQPLLLHPPLPPSFMMLLTSCIYPNWCKEEKMFLVLSPTLHPRDIIITVHSPLHASVVALCPCESTILMHIISSTFCPPRGETVFLIKLGEISFTRFATSFLVSGHMHAYVKVVMPIY